MKATIDLALQLQLLDDFQPKYKCTFQRPNTVKQHQLNKNIKLGHIHLKVPTNKCRNVLFKGHINNLFKCTLCPEKKINKKLNLVILY